jgi:hypothetical protein
MSSSTKEAPGVSIADFDEQSLRLMKTFFEVKDHKTREHIIALAEGASRDGKNAERPESEGRDQTPVR